MRQEQGTLIVSGRASYPSTAERETMHAFPDPADPDQAVIVNVPFFVNGLNFGDVVRLGKPDEIGIRPVEAIVIPSGHTRFLALTGFLSAPDLVDRLHHAFPSYALRIEGDGEGLLSVSVHPDLVPDEVVYEVFDWFEEEGIVPGDESVGVTSLFESRVGPLF